MFAARSNPTRVTSLPSPIAATLGKAGRSDGAAANLTQPQAVDPSKRGIARQSGAERGRARSSSRCCERVSSTLPALSTLDALLSNGTALAAATPSHRKSMPGAATCSALPRSQQRCLRGMAHEGARPPSHCIAAYAHAREQANRRDPMLPQTELYMQSALAARGARTVARSRRCSRSISRP